MAMAWAMLAALALGGCANKPNAGAPAGPSVFLMSGEQTQAQLSQLAAQEALTTDRSVAAVDEVQFPPGIDATALQPIALSNRVARAARAEALAELALANSDQDEPQLPQRPTDPEIQAQALKHYSRGRNAALDNRHTQAIFELQKALAIDPGSPQILRELARSYMASGNNARAAELFEQIWRLDSEDSEAAFVVALNAANRRDFSRAASVLGRFMSAGRSFSHDPAADVLADFILATCLRELGYDRAFIETAQAPLSLTDDLNLSTENAARLASVYRQRGDTWRAVGDAHCRLGDYQSALAAYAKAEALKVSDASTLRPRIVYANLRIGRVHTAQRELLRFLKVADPPVTDQDIRLCGYVRDHVGSVDLLAAAVRDLYSHRNNDSALVRAAASLLPDDAATSLLREFVGRRPRDLNGVRELLEWLAHENSQAAAALAAALADDHPDLAADYTDQLIIAIPRLSQAWRAVRQTPASPGRAQLEIRLLARAAALGKAWSACEAARQQWPDDRGLMMLELDIAASLGDRALFEQSRARITGIDDATGLAMISRAHRTLGDLQGARQAARRALDVDPNNADALIALATANAAQAIESMPAEATGGPASADLTQAAEAAELALAADPRREEPYAILAAIYGPRSSLAETRRYRELLQRLRQTLPASSLYKRIEAREALGQQRYELAVEKLVSLCEANPVDAESLRMLITAWEGWKKLDLAEQWLDQRFGVRPGDALLLEQWMRVKLLQQKVDQAIARLEHAMINDPEDHAARHLLEQVYRAAAKPHLALELAEQRLLGRPQSIRRELELAVMYAEADLPHQALARLNWVLERAAQATLDELSAALVVAGRVEGQPQYRDELTLALAQVASERFPDAPLQVYGSGLRALARQGALDERFDRLANAAAQQARSAAGPSVQSALLWQELAQGLVDDGHPAAAAQALRVRLAAATTLEPPARGLLVRLILIADAGAALESTSDAERLAIVQRSIELLRQLALRNQLAFVFSGQEAMTLAEAMYELSSIQTILGLSAGAQLLLEEVLQLQPNHPMVMNNLGYARIESGASDAVTVRWIEQAHALMPHDPHILDTIGWLRYKQGQFSDGEAPGALSLIQRAQGRAEEPSPEVLDHLGDVEWRLGNRDAAARAWHQALTVLDDKAFQQRETQTYAVIQSRVWHLVVADARRLYDLHHGAVHERTREKLEALERGEEPPVAPTFAELAATNP